MYPAFHVVGNGTCSSVLIRNKLSHDKGRIGCFNHRVGVLVKSSGRNAKCYRGTVRLASECDVSIAANRSICDRMAAFEDSALQLSNRGFLW